MTALTGEFETKYKQSKTEASTAQATLQKEITTLRDTNRTLQLRLRDIEVANDDFERQARHTTSSLEDIESKYNVAIERGVMLEEEVKQVEQEREALRIEAQRLRDELSDLKIEAEIVQDKLRNAEASIERHHERKTHALVSEGRPRSPVLSETDTSATTISSPTASTPPPLRIEASNAPTPPSPPISEPSASVKKAAETTMVMKKRPTVPDANLTPRPGNYTPRPPRHSRGPSIPVMANGRATPSIQRTQAPPPRARSSMVPQGENALPRSGSLYQIRGLIGKMQKLEERVHSARSKLPAPTNTPPRASPRNASAMGHHVPSNVTVRSSRKRASGSTSSSFVNGTEATGVSRLSLGGPTAERPGTASRPDSRASIASHSSANPYARPSSRTSMSGARTPLGNYPTSGPGEIRRPRSSMGGNFASAHGHSASISGIDEKDVSDFSTPYARRTSTFDKGATSIPTPSALPRRQSGGLARRTSSGFGDGDAAQLERRSRKLSEVGETF